MIYNSEDMTFNQIKTSETLLKDKTNCPWIVGYLANGTTINSTPINYKIPSPYADLDTFTSAWNSRVSTAVCNELRHTINNKIVFDYDFSFGLEFAYGGYIMKSYAYEDGSYKRVNLAINEYDYLRCKQSDNSYFQADQTMIGFSNQIQSKKATIENAIETGYNIQTDVNNIMAYNGKVLYDDNTGKYYKANITIKSTSNYNYSVQKLTPTLINIMNGIIGNLQYLEGNPNWSWRFQEGYFNDDSVSLNMNISYLEYSLSEVSAETINYGISNTVNTLQDAPYTMFALPYGECTFRYLDAGTLKEVTINESDAKSISTAVAFNIIETKGGGANPALYDIQLLPYCPLQNNIDSSGAIYLDISSYYQTITNSTSGVVSLMLFPLESRFTFNIPYNVNITDYKISNECDMYRLCSPNWNGQFEFSAAKNGGINTINVDCEYKPFQPYIHLNPNFKVLYGQDFNDGRGLICNGDFSLTQIADAWSTYQRQNVNYEKQFNRQIQNMEVNNSIALKQMKIQAVAGTVNAATTGAMTGGMIGGPIGAVIGGAVAGGASAAAAVADINFAKQLQAEAIDYTQDQFGYQLGNIQALPDSLTKVSVFNNNNKLFPLIEYYTCTEQEKEALRNKLKYNGMTVMRIGTISEFIQPDYSYIKGKLIRLENVGEDYHMVGEIANEINKGVFIK